MALLAGPRFGRTVEAAICKFLEVATTLERYLARASLAYVSGLTCFVRKTVSWYPVVALTVLAGCVSEPVQWGNVAYRSSQLGDPDTRSAIASAGLPTITGTVAHDEAKGQGEHGTAAAALPTLTATSVKRHGMTCPE